MQGIRSSVGSTDGLGTVYHQVLNSTYKDCYDNERAIRTIFMTPFLTPVICHIGIRRVSPMMARLLAGAMRAVDLMRPFSHSFASWPVASAYADERTVHDAPQLSCVGWPVVLPWSSLLKGWLQYAIKPAWGLTISAHCYILRVRPNEAIHAQDSAGRRNLVVEDDIEEGAMDV